MMFWLKVGAQRFPLREGETTLGRSPYCSIVIESLEASREHATIRLHSREVVLTDLDSRNGTLLNGQPVVHPTRLNPGDRIEVGSQEVELVETVNVSADVVSTAERDVNGRGQPTISAPARSAKTDEPDRASRARSDSSKDQS